MFIMLWKENGNRTWIKGQTKEDLEKYAEELNLDIYENETEIFELKWT